MTARLHMAGVTKTFPGVRALDDVSITVHAGEVLGLVGVNGAGKSTLMNVLGGIYLPDAGTIEIDGRPVQLHRPMDADQAGIAFIHQELLFFPTLTVAENMFISHLPSGRTRFTVDKRIARARASEALDQLGSDIRPNARMEDLSVGEKQVVEIARALAMGSDIVIFDEPSSSLSIKEKEALFAIVRKLKAEGKAVIYISHFLDEIQDLCDSYVVLRNGRLVGAGQVVDVTHDQIIEMVVGQAVSGPAERSRRAGDAPLLTLSNIRRGEILTGVDLVMRRGEVLGLWGLMGSGRTELIRAILGLEPMDAGQLSLTDEGGMRQISPAELLTRTAYVTESRRTDGLFLDEAIWKNITATTLEDFVRGWMQVLDKAAEAETAKTLIDRLKIRTRDYRTRAANLSGGNQQKVVFAKWLSRQPDILILDEPTRGVDVGAKREIGALIGSLADAGTSVLLVTSEIEEMVALADRVLVLRGGVIAAEMSGDAISEAALMAAAMGTEAADA
ncbi:MAG: sugar ABC transporter ATP-binding protein [Hyphomicrobiales bacterium]|nr:sugar ABC transporter ATP-binding protein [Hyphomicrobiales bacterium]